MSMYFGAPTFPPCMAHQMHDLNKRNFATASKEKDFLLYVNKEIAAHSLTVKDILLHGYTDQDQKSLQPSDVYVVYLPHKCLQDISLIDVCKKLRLCIINNNFIKDITPLKWCVNLIFIDAHSNQITHLPNGNFWSSLSNLTTVYLHDNGIYKIDEVKHLGLSPSLCCLTMYDTPISLKKNYRHCVVNAVWSLKALDYYVVSDEEIIEDANFPTRFKSLQVRFKYHSSYISWCKEKQQTICNVNVAELINKDLASINQQQSKLSPVLLIQKIVRGFLVRLRFNYVKETRLWAAVCIQRFYRRFFGMRDPQSSINLLDNENRCLSSMKVDYDTYLKVKRSIEHSSVSVKSDSLKMNHRVSFAHQNLEMPDDLTYGNLLRKRISVDLEKLQGKATESWETKSQHSTALIEGIDSKSKEGTIPHEITVTQKSCMDEYGVGISVRKPYVLTRDPLEEIVLRTVEGAADIRRFKYEIDHLMKNRPLPKNVSSKKQLNADQTLYLKTQGSMGLSCFYAVEKAYKDRHKAEKLLKRMNHVRKIKNIEKNLKEKVKSFKENYRQEAADAEEKERVTMALSLSDRTRGYEDSLDRIVSKRNIHKKRQELCKRDYRFSVEFSARNASVGKALTVHDHRTRKEVLANENKEYVRCIRGQMETKKTLVAINKNNNKLAKQLSTLEMKKNLESKLKEMSIERDRELSEFLELHDRKMKMNSPIKLAVHKLQPPHC